MFHRQPSYLSSALAGEWVALDEIADGLWSVYLCDVEIARYNERTQQLHR